MAQKFGRAYELNIGTQDGGTLVVNLPFTIEFDISRNILKGNNTCVVRIYNLSVKNRNNCRYNFYNTGELRPFSFNAGYTGFGKSSGVLPLAFAGNITQASSVREGNNMVTTIESLDGGFASANSQINLSIPASPSSPLAQQDLIGQVAQSLTPYGVQVGAIGAYPSQITRGTVFSGNACDLLDEQTKGGFFIDNGVINCLGNSETLNNDILVINSASGLLGTPVLQQTILSFDMLFEPRLAPGQQVNLDSITEANYNGFYKIISLRHRGMISAAICGDAVTSLEMFYGPEGLTPVEAFF